MNARFVRSAVVLLGVSAAASSQGLAWVQVATTGPIPREGHGFAYDAARQRTVLFGGWVSGVGLGGDTWEWNGAAWAQRAVAGPTARKGLAMAYDSLRQRTVLFGGWDGAFRADTWEWDGAAWVPQVLATGPGPRENHAMAFDSQRGRVVLFGGYVPAPISGYFWLGDTWEWNGAVWVQATASGPIGRAWPGMAFDSQRGRTVLFGGANPNGSLTSFLGDTWEWDGVAWVQRSTSGPAPRANHAMSYDSTRGVTLVMGGQNSGSPGPNFLWEWNGTSWTNAGNWISREGAEMAFDSHRNRTVMFGGTPYAADTWELVSTLAGGTPFGTGCGAPPLALAGVLSAPPSLGSTAQAAITNAPSPVAFVALGVSNTTFGPFTLPVSLASIGMPGCNLLQSTEVVGESTTPNGVGTASYNFAIPNNPALIGFHVYLQAWAWAPGANPANIIVSNGLDWQVGV